ncbi:MAG: DNA polymerase Y family protein [Proteobacteria bacterium]|nr:DNA polymerase Y family protein [Pseudomonadota bacterium]
MALVGERFCAVYLPAFRIERLGYAPEELVAVIAEQKNATRLVAASPAALDEGLSAGMTITAARAIVPELLSEPVDEAGEAVDRATLVEQFRRLSDRVGAWGESGVVLEISGSAHLFGEEEGVLDAAAHLTSRLGHLGRIAIADDPVAAMALAMWSSQPLLIVPPGRAASALSELPLCALQPPDRIAEALRTVGIELVGDFACLDAASVAGRYGDEGVRLHRIARGHGLNLGGWEQLDQTEISDIVPLGGPTSTVEPILFLLPGLLGAMVERAAQRDEVVVRVALRFVLESGPARLLRVRVGRPTRDVELLMRLLRARLEGLRVESPVVELGVIFEETSDDPGWQPGLLDRATEAEPMPDLLARLTDALGDQALVGLVVRDQWRPEYASVEEAPFARAPRATKPAKVDPVEVQDRAERDLVCPRPTLLLPRPRPIDVREDALVPSHVRLQDGWQRVMRVEGPERLAGDWWTDSPFERDYWIVETRSGSVAWIFREDARWYCQGWFD